MKNKLYRKRNKSLGVQRISFNNMANTVVPEQFQDILLADRIGDQRILVFAHHNMREIIAHSNSDSVMERLKHALESSISYSPFMSILGVRNIIRTLFPLFMLCCPIEQLPLTKHYFV